MGTENTSPGGLARVVYREILEGDRRKFIAESNDSETGGGARDLRFRPYDKFGSIFSELFPLKDTVSRKRDGVKKSLERFMGTFYWSEHDKPDQKMNAYFEPPTDARPNEGRIAKVHTYPCFHPSRVPVTGTGDRLFLLLVQNANGEVWVHFVSESALRTDERWDPQFVHQIIACISGRRPKAHAVQGYIDYISGRSFCNGK